MTTNAIATNQSHPSRCLVSGIDLDNETDGDQGQEPSSGSDYDPGEDPDNVSGCGVRRLWWLLDSKAAPGILDTVVVREVMAQQTCGN